jgi:hypothetical protein
MAPYIPHCGGGLELPLPAAAAATLPSKGGEFATGLSAAGTLIALPCAPASLLLQVESPPPQWGI